MMKRTLILLAALTLLCGDCASAQAEEATQPAASAKAEAQQSVTVGITTQMSGNFYSDMWGNNTVDADIRAMLHGYDTIVWKSAGEYGVDQNVVTDFATGDGNGGRTYTITLADDLVYNDGTPVTAADYVFAILLQSDPAIVQLGGMNTNYSHVVGWSDYAAGDAETLSGVRLLSDTQFSISVPDSALPYFYELTYASVQPCPIGEIAPDYSVRDDGAGAYLALPDETDTPVPTKLMVELLETGFTAPDGYLHMPRVTCGPYQLESYDAETSSASFSINPLYKGNYEGQQPSIEQVRVVQVDSKDAIAAFQSGDIQILNKFSDGAVITEANALVANGEALSTNYLRSGYAFLGYACELEPTNDVAVRQALALCIDRDTLINDVFAGNGLSVGGYYGYGQWMAAQHMDELTQFEIGYDVNAAQALLEQAGYTYNEEGTDYAAGQNQIRCKVEDGKLVPLELSWAKAASTPGDALEQQLVPVLESLGIRIAVREMSFSELLREYYRADGARSDQLYFLSDNFFHVFDPYYNYNTGDEWQGIFNTSGLRDTALMEAADAMRRVSGSDTDTYYLQWLAFQTRWHEVMPAAPVYSNVYFDVYIPTLNNYQPGAQYGFSSALLYASFGEAAPEPTATPEATTGDEEIIID